MKTTTADITAALASRPSINLDELNSVAALQTRIDRKYVVAEHDAAAILRSFGTEAEVLETEGRRSFTYESVYFDTAELDAYKLAAHGRRRRYKIRTRTYVDSNLSFLEVKTEGARAATVKERIPYRLEDRRRITGEGLAYINETLKAVVGSVPSGPLSPVLETRYDRITLYLPDSRSRATIDLDVTWHRPHGATQVLHGAVVLETKSGSTPGPLDQHLWAHGIRPCRISKFATGMAALNPLLPSNRWHRTLSRNLPLRFLSVPS